MCLNAAKTCPKLLAILWLLCAFGHASFAQLSVDFSLDKAGGCSPLAVNFTNKTTGASPAAVYSWDFGNGNVSSQTSAGAIYTDVKTYTVTLTVLDGPSQSSRSRQVTVYQPPIVDFTPSIVKGCLPLTVTFTSVSNPGDGVVASYVWDFGDGVTQKQGSFTQDHTYQVVQQSPVSLTVVNTYGCHTTVTKPALIQVIPQLFAGFSSDKQILCLATDPVQFTNTSSGPGTLDYLWDFGDGHTSTQKDPQYAFNVAGIYTVKLTVHSSEGCTALSTQPTPLNVASYHTDFDIPALICQGSTAVFAGNSTPTPNFSNWLIDGVNTGYYYNYMYGVFNVPGTHTVTLQNTFGVCPQSVSKQVSVKSIPNPTPFSIDMLGKCGAPVTVNFKDATPGVTAWAWDFTYNGYSSTNQSKLQAPSFTYTNNGPYTVWLQVTNADGCSTTSAQVVQVTPPNVVIETPDVTRSCGSPITAGFQMFTSETLTAVHWNFGDGGSSTDPSPTHTFNGPGTYNVSLGYTTQNGCQGTSNTISVIISSPIKVDFSALNTTICGNNAAQFTAGPYDPNIVYWTWDFGDGEPTYPTTYNAIHVYTAPGTYTIKLALSDLGGCDTVIVKTNYITVLPPFPKISGFAHTCDSSRGRVQFTQSSLQANSVTWSFGDGSTLTTPGDQATASHVYTKTGSYPVTLTASNGQCSVSDVVTVPVLLKQDPLLTSPDTTICTNGRVPIQVTNLENNPNPFSDGDQYFLQKIEYKDGTAFQGNLANDNPSYIWVPPFSGEMSNFAAGEQGFRIIIGEADFGCFDTTNFIPMAIKGGIASFSVAAPPSCYLSPVVFSDNSHSTPNDPILSWYWDFGDGQSARNNQGGNVSHPYANPGSYLVNLTITDAGGCLSQSPAYQYVNVNGPKASFSVSGTNVPLNTTVYFYNSTNSTGSYPTTYLWDFGDGTTSGDFSPVHTYPLAGRYTVTLTTSGPPGSCTTSAQQVIVVNNFNTAFNFSTSFVAGGCPPALVSFTNTSLNYSYVSWYFGDGDTCGNLNYPSHVYVKPGKYIVTLNVYAPNGVEGQYIDSVIIQVPNAALAAFPVPACLGDTITLSAKAMHAVSYLWDFGDGSMISSSDTAGKHIYSTAGSYQTALLMQDANGCSVYAGLAGPVIIRPKPTIHFAPAQPLVCRGAGMTLQSGDGGSIYNWSPSLGLSNNAIADPLASPAITTKYTLSVTDDIGCKNVDSVTVTVVQPGSLQLGPDTAICSGATAHLHASGESIYKWIDATDGLNDTKIPDPIAGPLSTIQYTVTGSDAYSCFSDTASLTVRVLPLPLVNAGPDVSLLAGYGTQLQATGSSDIVTWTWSPSQYLSCADCPSPQCLPLASTTYTVTAKGQDGCLAADTVVVKIDCEQSRVAIPNAFTPNGDGENDVFIVKGISIIKHIAVYSRLGERVYERSNIIAGDRASCWDGTFRGQKCPTGVYVYEVEMQCPTGGEFKRGGTVVLIR